MKQFLLTILVSVVFLFAQTGFSYNNSGIQIPGARTLGPGDLFIMGGFEMASSKETASIEGYMTDENGIQKQLDKESPSNSIIGYVGYGILRNLEVGMHLNFHYDGNAAKTKLKGLGFGDLGLMVKAAPPNQKIMDKVHVSAALEFFIPSGTNEKGLRPRRLWYIHEENTTHPYSAADFALAGTLYLSINFNKYIIWNNYAGYLRTFENSENVFVWGSGLSLFAYEWVSLVIEASGETWIKSNMLSEFVNDQIRFSPGLKIRLPKRTTLSISADLGMDLFRKRKVSRGHPITVENNGHSYSYTVPGSPPIAASIRLSRTFDLNGKMEDFKKRMDSCPKSGRTFKENGYKCAPDEDEDGIANDLDQCPDTPENILIDDKGCPLDQDKDGVPDYLDKCSDTKEGYPTDEDGCIRDADKDGVPDELDRCPRTPAGNEVNEKGCLVDSDEDGIPNIFDKCPETPTGLSVNKYGCILDNDQDGVPDEWDKCQDSAPNEAVNKEGCPVDSDEDGIPDVLDKCEATPQGVKVDSIGCRLDMDHDGVFDEDDRCANTPEDAPVDTIGCPLDSDHDGIYDYLDNCPNTIEKTEVDMNGCPIREKQNLDKIARRIMFHKGTDKPLNSSYTALSDIVSIMRHNKLIALEIQCSVKSGEAMDPQALSEARANLVFEFLTNKGIKEDRLKAAGYGLKLPTIDREHTKLNPVGIRLLPHRIIEE
ncbi:MAG: thrombospondin type 3 repeat-containing protein [Fibrobacter sp.]|nr:thrombospondin type 3 repeat-containing protein [Fibrobacter sp.]